MHDKSIVLSLQEMSTDRCIDVSDLLRKALVVATKLKLEDFKQWLKWELFGYDEDCEDVPEYRKIRAVMKVWNPYHGLQPLFMPAEIESKLCNVSYRSAISNAVSILETQRENRDSSPPLIPLSAQQKNFLMQNMDLPLEPHRLVSTTQLEMLVDAVRTTILEWSLKLEEAGILGEGLVFSKEEKEIAAKNTEIHIKNFQGVLGDVSNSHLSQNLDMTVTEGDFQTLRNYLQAQGVEDADIDHLEQIIDDEMPERSGQYGQKVSEWLGMMITKAATGAWGVGTGMAGNLLATAISAYYGLG